MKQKEQKKTAIQKLASGLFTKDEKVQLQTATRFRLLLQKAYPPPIDEVLDAPGVILCFLEFLDRDDYPQLQFEALWVVTNIASGNSQQTDRLIKAGVVPLLVRLLTSADDEILELAAWALGNIAGDSPDCQDVVLAHWALPYLVSLCKHNENLFVWRTASWALSNFCRDKPQPPVVQTRRMFVAWAKLIYSGDEEVLMNTCRALSYLSDSDGIQDEINFLCYFDICQRFIELLFHPSFSIVVPVLQTVGNIISRGDYTQCCGDVLKYKTLECLWNLLKHKDYYLEEILKKEACLILSKITSAGNHDVIQAVIDADVIPALIQLPDYLTKEATRILKNAISHGENQEIKSLVGYDCVKYLCDLLVCPDPEIVRLCLECLEGILKMGKVKMSEYTLLVEEANGLEKIENLQSHADHDIDEKALKILETYWSLVDDADDQMQLG